MWTLFQYFRISVYDSVLRPFSRSIIGFTVLLTFLFGCAETPSSKQGSSKESTASPDRPPSSPVEKRQLNFHQRPEYQRLAQAGEWPAFAGPHQNFSVNPGGKTDLASKSKRKWSNKFLEPVWSVEIGTGYSTPIAGDDRIYLFHRQGDEERIDCRDLQSGKIIWQFGSPTEFKSGSSFSNGPYSTPVIDAETIYALGTEAKLYCLSRDNGELKQLRDLQLDYKPKSDGLPPGGSLILLEDLVIVNLGGTINDSSVVGINCKTGTTIWHAFDEQRSFFSPRYARFYGQLQLLLATKNYFRSINPQTGEPNWKVDFTVNDRPEYLNAAVAAIVDERIILAAGKNADLICLKVQQQGRPKEIWRSRGKRTRYQSNMIVLDDSLIFARENRNGEAELLCVALHDGKVRWKEKLLLRRASLLLLHHELIMLGENGQLSVWRVDSRIPRLVYQTKQPVLKGPCRTAPIFAQGKLILRDEQEMIAFEL